MPNDFPMLCRVGAKQHNVYSGARHGRYYLIETATVEGLQLLSGRVSFVLMENGATAELALANQRVPAPEDGGILLKKTSAADGTLLPGAVFGVYDAATDEKVGELTIVKRRVCVDM